MPSEEAVALSKAHRGLVIAPAGCGKTYLLAEAVACSSGRQLVLTHTHVGVRAIRGHLERQSVPSAKYLVTTIDGLALRYASHFPTLSGWTIAMPEDDDWKQLRVASRKVVDKASIRRVLLATYAGVFVDEYQDCSVGQHELVLRLAEFLPVRIVGDPLQAVFTAVNKDDSCKWKDVQSHFPWLATLTTPYRWNQKNRALGEWLLRIRECLIAGKEIDLSVAPLVWKPTSNDRSKSHIIACRGVRPKHGESTIAMLQWRAQCYGLAKSLSGQFRGMETVECAELLQWAQTFDDAKGIERATQMFQFVGWCISGMPTEAKKLATQIAEGKVAKPRRDDFKKIVEAIYLVRDSESVCSLLELMEAILGLKERLVRFRDELWREMKRTLKEHRLKCGSSLRETAWRLRTKLRHIGGRLDHTAIGTTLLVKGLEYDHAVVLDADQHIDAESIYVAITRASRSLTILSSQPVLQRSKPRFVLET